MAHGTGAGGQAGAGRGGRIGAAGRRARPVRGGRRRAAGPDHQSGRSGNDSGAVRLAHPGRRPAGKRSTWRRSAGPATCRRARVTAWFESAPAEKTAAEMALVQDRRCHGRLPLPPAAGETRPRRAPREHRSGRRSRALAQDDPDDAGPPSAAVAGIRRGRDQTPLRRPDFRAGGRRHVLVDAVTPTPGIPSSTTWWSRCPTDRVSCSGAGPATCRSGPAATIRA